jgi:hypothetical protein
VRQSADVEIQLQHHVPSSVALHPFVRRRGAGDVVAHLLERLAVVRRAARGRVQAEPAHVGARRLLEAGVARELTF